MGQCIACMEMLGLRERFTEAVLEFIHITGVGKMTEEAKVGYGPLVEQWAGDARHEEWLRSRLREQAMDGVG